MQYTFFIVLIILTFQAKAQDTLAIQARQTIETFFDGFHEGDTVKMIQTLYSDVKLQTAFKTKDGKDVLHIDDIQKLLNAIAERPENQKWEERILDYVVQVDGNMANVWTPYEFYVNGEFSHCGANSFQLFNDSGSWKIIYLMDTRRRSKCSE